MAKITTMDGFVSIDDHGNGSITLYIRDTSVVMSASDLKALVNRVIVE